MWLMDYVIAKHGGRLRPSPDTTISFRHECTSTTAVELMGSRIAYIVLTELQAVMIQSVPSALRVSLLKRPTLPTKDERQCYQQCLVMMICTVEKQHSYLRT